MNSAVQNLERLKQGFLFWNKYRESQEELIKGVDFSELQFDGDLWRHNELKNADLSNSQFRQCEFRNIDFLDVNFRGSDFGDATFNNVHFTMCAIDDSSFKNVVFRDVIWYYTDFSKVDFSKINDIQNMRFYKCSFPVDLRNNLNIPEDAFVECKFI